ncbi:MAG: hypothetical protein L6V93_07770 [Clostridiales bacterium]|nr:MAG: hypothetical protein L6V93_07770 [Clostridiales bacterium]
MKSKNKEKLNEISQKYNLPECVSALVLNRCEEDAEPYIEKRYFVVFKSVFTLGYARGG